MTGIFLFLSRMAMAMVATEVIATEMRRIAGRQGEHNDQENTHCTIEKHTDTY
jgi:hypothetical protein